MTQEVHATPGPAHDLRDGEGPVYTPLRLLMSSPVQTAAPTTPLGEVERRMARHGVSSLPVVDVGGRVHGVVSRFDLLRVGRLRARTAGADRLLVLPDQPAGRFMHSPPLTAGLRERARDAARVMVERHVHRVFVTDEERLVGVVSTKDLLRVVSAARIAAPVAAWMSTPLCVAETTETIAEATDRMAAARVSGLVVTDGGWPVGLYTQLEALDARELPPDTPVATVMSPALLCLPADTPLFRAADLAMKARARRVLACDHREVLGIVTGLDLARAALSA